VSPRPGSVAYRVFMLANALADLVSDSTCQQLGQESSYKL
jgi:hypothetical protein